MNPESKFDPGSEGQGKYSNLVDSVGAAAQRIKEMAHASEAKVPISEIKHDNPAVLMSLARTKTHKDFEHVEDILERNEMINKKKAEINGYVIIPDGHAPDSSNFVEGKIIITVSEFKKRFLE